MSAYRTSSFGPIPLLCFRWIAARSVSTTLRQALTKFSEFFMCLVFRKEISRQDRLATTIANSVDPLHPRFFPRHAFPFPKRSLPGILIASKEILAFSDLRAELPSWVSSASSHRQRFRTGNRLVDPDLARMRVLCLRHGDDGCFFIYFPGRSSKKRIQIDR